MKYEFDTTTGEGSVIVQNLTMPRLWLMNMSKTWKLILVGLTAFWVAVLLYLLRFWYD